MNIKSLSVYRCISPDAPMAGDLVIPARVSVVNGDPAHDIVHFTVLTGPFASESFDAERATFDEDFIEAKPPDRAHNSLNYWRTGTERPAR